MLISFICIWRNVNYGSIELAPIRFIEHASAHRVVYPETVCLDGFRISNGGRDRSKGNEKSIVDIVVCYSDITCSFEEGVC
jgi:hypothetical protein